MKLKLIQPVIAAVCALATACTPLSAFNTFAPKDPAGGPAVRGLAYGTHARQKLDVYPALGAAGAAPVIVFFYGGGWDSGRRQDYAWAGRALAAQGFLTIVADYRLVPEVRFPAFLEDCAHAVRWAQTNAARLGGDPQRIVLVGHSAGAYNAVMLALDQRYLAAAGVDASAIRGVIGLAGPYDFYPFDVAASINAFGSYPAPLQTQPVTFARADAQSWPRKSAQSDKWKLCFL
jgi:acetyl esterase/lipase